MLQWAKVLAAISEYLSLIPRMDMVLGENRLLGLVCSSLSLTHKINT